MPQVLTQYLPTFLVTYLPGRQASRPREVGRCAGRSQRWSGRCVAVYVSPLCLSSLHNLSDPRTPLYKGLVPISLCENLEGFVRKEAPLTIQESGSVGPSWVQLAPFVEAFLLVTKLKARGGRFKRQIIKHHRVQRICGAGVVCGL